MSEDRITYHLYSEKALLISWSQDTLNVIQKRRKMLRDIATLELGFYVSNEGAYSIMIIWANPIHHQEAISLIQKEYAKKVLLNSSHEKIWRLPILYDETSEDMQWICKTKALQPNEVIKLHSSTVYEVDFIGFLPGFPYLKGLDSKLHLPRKETPSPHIAAGAVAISNGYCGIYPTQSPGGWYVLGNSPIVLFDINRVPHCFLKSGDQVVFEPITKALYQNIKNEVPVKELSFKKHMDHG